jgi:hypothetical protein
MFHWEASAKRAGARHTNVRCEKCDEWYHYEIVRTGRGESRSISEDAAAAGAELVAAARVTQELDRGVEIVPCPKCGWVQADMVKELKRRTGQWLLLHIKIAVAAAAILFAVHVGMRLFATPDEPHPRIIEVRYSIIAVGVAAMLVVLRLMLQRQVDPNIGHPSRRAAPLATAVGIPGKANAQMLQQHAPAE